MDNSKYAQLTDDMLEKVTDLENKLEVILIAYDPAMNHMQEDNTSNEGNRSVSPINPS